MRFVLNGSSMTLEAGEVIRRLHGVAPEPVREHGVRVGGVVYPVKQAFEVATGVPRAGFITHTALRHLRNLGFEVTGTIRPTGPQARPFRPVATVALTPTDRDPHGWPWEGHVQNLFALFLQRHGWQITSMADTATKVRGVDLLAHNGVRRLGAEVKGWPSDGYADPRRADEAKRTPASTQAGHWFSQALFKGILLLDSHPGHESLMVLPDYPRYRDLTERTRSGRQAAGVHVVLIGAEGQVTAGTWSP